jgi:type I restriction-modification system DNA methylase subunit
MYLLSRFLTLENASKLKIPEKFAWENLMNTADKSKELALNQFGIDSDCLIAYFDKLFDTQKFTFEMGKNRAEHCKIMEILNDIKIHDVDITMDILGYVYEEHLEHGSCNPRDLGQFFTSRQICKYMVKLCAPKYKRSGVPESVCDPTMGTAGFLTAYVKYYDLVDWDVHQDQVHGWDHDNKVAGYARLNMFLESGGTRFENLHCADSLKGGIGSYDIILANMPFGLKGLKYADCNPAVKELGIDGTKAEPLFLQMMMVSLNPGGRCAVIVPDGMLVNVSKCHNMTRKYLVKNFNLKCVIKMSGEMFANTKVKTSILLFEKTGDTQEIEFAEIDTGSVVMHVKTIDVSELDSNYSLGFQKYMQSDVSFNFPMVALSEILKPVKGKRYSVSEGSETGKYPLLRSSKDGKVKWMDEYTYEGPYLTVGNGGLANFQCHK